MPRTAIIRAMIRAHRDAGDFLKWYEAMIALHRKMAR